VPSNKPLTLEEVVEQQQEEDKDDEEVRQRNLVGLKKLQANLPNNFKVRKQPLP